MIFNIYLDSLSIRVISNMKDPKKIEYLISLFFNTGRLIKEQSCHNEDIDPISMLKIEAIRLIEKEKPTMKRIAEYLHIKAPSATSLINGLVKMEYVKRVADPNDRRVVQMIVTDKGKNFFKKGVEQMNEKLKEVLLKLKQDQLDNFIQIMEEIKKAYK